MIIIFKIEGTYNQAQAFSDTLDELTIQQVKGFLDEAYTADERIAIMPDAHAGKGSVVGTTMTLRSGKVCPNLVGVDIGCGIHVTEILPTYVDVKQLDRLIKQRIPSGFKVHREEHSFPAKRELSFDLDNPRRARQSLGTLGGGNHFIELAQGEKGELYLMIHSGSRGLGHNVATHHQEIAEQTNRNVRQKALAYLEGDLLEAYMNDLKIAQQYAALNREKMAATIVEGMKWESIDTFDSIHNYIDPVQGILRKGATDASEGKRLVIPLNMKDGSVIARGKGNEAWNYSAPHGAGRRLSRTQARKQIDLRHFKRQMQDVYSTSINKSTLDEAPDAYKKPAEILSVIGDSVEIETFVKPLYNFKA